MSKIASLQAGLDRAAGRSVAAPTQASVPGAPPPVRTISPKAPSREGKVHIGAYLPGGFKSSLRLVQAQTGEDTQTLIARALNELFRGHNVPVIDLE
jgi:Antitoxin-like ribbon-helix-helix